MGSCGCAALNEGSAEPCPRAEIVWPARSAHPVAFFVVIEPVGLAIRPARSAWRFAPVTNWHAGSPSHSERHGIEVRGHDAGHRLVCERGRDRGNR